MFPQHHAVRHCFGLIGLGVLQTFPVLAVPIEQSVSASRQFIVYGTNVPVRGAICDLAESTKRDLLALLARRDRWITPIVINAHYPQANLPEASRIALTMSQTGFGLKLQLDLTIDPNGSLPAMRRELLRALLVEMMSRDATNIAAGSAYSTPPDWLLDGVPSQQINADRGINHILVLPVARHSILPLAKFLRQNPQLLDAPAQSLYRAYSFALVDLLSRSPEGPARLAQFIADLSSARDAPMSDLRAHFPGLFDSEAIAEKKWETHVRCLSNQQPYELLGSAATERSLDESLHLKISAGSTKKSCELARFPVFLKEPSAKKVLTDLSRDLSALAVQANPIYRPVIFEYVKDRRSIAPG